LRAVQREVAQREVHASREGVPRAAASPSEWRASPLPYNYGSFLSVVLDMIHLIAWGITAG
jgi:hypothetical protein